MRKYDFSSLENALNWGGIRDWLHGLARKCKSAHDAKQKNLNTTVTLLRAVPILHHVTTKRGDSPQDHTGTNQQQVYSQVVAGQTLQPMTKKRGHR